MQLSIELARGKTAKTQVVLVTSLAGDRPDGLSWGIWQQNKKDVAQHRYQPESGKPYTVVCTGRDIKHVLQGQAELFGIVYILGGQEDELEYMARTIILVQANAVRMKMLGKVVRIYF
jgi:hypothetical protein